MKLSELFVYLRMIVYFHRNPITYEIFYVGIGTKEKRANAMDRRNPYWKSYVNKYGRPVVQIVHPDLSKEKAKEWEVFYIKLLKRKCDGGPLTNITEGGDHHPTEYPEVIEKIKQKALPHLLKWMKENPEKNPSFTPEHSERMRKYNPMFNEATVKKISEINTGKKASDETRLKQSLLKKGKPSNQPKGYKHSPEVIERMRLINKEIVNRPEVKDKLRLSMFGKRNTSKHVPVIMIDPKNDITVMQFECAMDAGRYFGKPNTGNISSVCNGRRNVAFGYKWKYAS